MEFVLVLFIGAVVIMVILAKVMAGTNTYLESARSPQAVRQQVESLFNSKLNRFETEGTVLLVTPRLKMNAPTLHIDMVPNGSGSKVHMWAKVMMQKRGIGPWVPYHPLYIWRKQRRIAKAIEQAG